MQLPFRKKEGVYVACDIGGSRLRVAVSRDGEILHEEQAVSTPKPWKGGLDALCRLIAEKVKGERIRAIVCGVPGTRDEQGRIYKLPNLPLWNGKDLSGELSQRFGAPAYLENDTALVGLGEAHRGAGRGASILVYVTVSTGFGGARIVGGKIDAAHFGFEPGHQIIDETRWPQWREGVLGDRVSGWAIRAHTGKSPTEALADHALAGELARQLAIGLFNMTLHWSPERIVLGGPLIVGENPIPLAKVETYFNELVRDIYAKAPVLSRAELKDEGGLLGAVVFGKQKSG